MAFEGEPRVIPIRGIARAGADSIVEDGAMNEVIGLEYKDGSFVPYSGTDNGHPFREDVQKFYVHKTSTQTNVILRFADGLYWISESGFYDGAWEDDLGELGPILEGTTIKDVDFIGNIICVSSESGVENFLFKGWGYETYTIKEESLPTIKLRATIGLPNAGNSIGVHLSSGMEVEHTKSFGRYDSVIPLQTKTKGLVRDKGGLTGYTVACVAYRLNTGEYKLASAPIVLGRPMNANATCFGRYEDSTLERPYIKYEANNYITMKGGWNGDNEYDLLCDYNDPDSPVKNSYGEGMEFRCFYKDPAEKKPVEATPEPHSTPTVVSTVVNGYIAEIGAEIGITNWDVIYTYVTGNKIQYKVSGGDDILSNLISGICVFMSKEIDPFEEANDKEDLIYGEEINPEVYSDITLLNSLYPKLKSTARLEQEIVEVDNFYKVAEYTYDEFLEKKDVWIDVDTKGKLGDALVTFDTLPPSAFNRDEDIYSNIFTYNSRLHLFDYKQKLFKGYSIHDFELNGGVGQYEESVQMPFDSIYIIVEGQRPECKYRVVKQEDTTMPDRITPLITYPSSDASRMHLFRRSGNMYGKISFVLKKSKFGGFSYAFKNSEETISYFYLDSGFTQEANPNFTEVGTIGRMNVLKASDTYSPNYFPPANTYSVGKGRIIGLASLSTALSQDTFGQYPLLVFCTDGIYSMAVDTNGVGVYNNIAPFSREVCVNPNSICEIDGAVLFASSKGLMIATSQGVQEFVPTMNGLNRHIPKDDNSYGVGLKWYRDIINNSSSTQLLDSVDDELDFRDYVASPDTYITYVSQKNKIVVYNGKQPYIYWIDIPTRNVTKLPTSIKMDNDNYPTELYVKADGSILEFNQLSAKGNTQTMFQTRPIKLDGGMKTDYRVVVRGHFESDEHDKIAALLVLGSYDGECWQPIGYKEKSLNGSFNDIGCDTDRVTHKYMMIIFSASLNRDSHIDGVELTKKNKYNNKLK